jgi:hypothetical protein
MAWSMTLQDMCAHIALIENINIHDRIIYSGTSPRRLNYDLIASPTLSSNIDSGIIDTFVFITQIETKTIHNYEMYSLNDQTGPIVVGEDADHPREHLQHDC